MVTGNEPNNFKIGYNTENTYAPMQRTGQCVLAEYLLIEQMNDVFQVCFILAQHNNQIEHWLSESLTF